MDIESRLRGEQTISNVSNLSSETLRFELASRRLSVRGGTKALRRRLEERLVQDQARAHDGDRCLPVGLGLMQVARSAIKQIAVGWDFALALSASGAVFAWGSGACGQLGNGLTEDSCRPVRVALPDASSPSPSTKRDTKYPALPNANMSPENHEAGPSERRSSFPALPNTGDFDAPKTESKSLSDAHAVVPYNLCTPTKTSIRKAAGQDPVMSIKAGAHHAAAITRSGRLWMWGSNNFGQLGVAVVAESKEGAGEAGANNATTNAISKPFDLTSASAQTSLCGYKIRSAALGWRHTVALSHSQVAWAWGYSTAPRTNVDTAADGTHTEETLEEDLELEMHIQSPQPIPMSAKLGRRCVQIRCGFSRTLSLTSAKFCQDEFDVLSSVADRVLVKGPNGQASPQTRRRESVISRAIINDVVHPDEFHDYDTQKERPTRAMLSRRRVSTTASPVPRLRGSPLTQQVDATPVKAAKMQRSPPKEVLRQMNQRDLVELARTLGRGKTRSGSNDPHTRSFVYFVTVHTDL